MDAKSKLYALSAATAVLCGPVQAQLRSVDLLDAKAQATLVAGMCTLENGLPVFRGDAAAVVAIDDVAFYGDAKHIAIQSVADLSVRGQIDMDALETIDMDEVARGLTICTGPAIMLQSKSNLDLRYIVFDEGSLGSYPVVGVTPAQLRRIATVHEYGHVYANRDRLDELGLALNKDPGQLGELLADAYMLLRLKSQDPAMAAPVDAFLQFRTTLTKRDQLHPVMPPAFKALLDARAVQLSPQMDDKAVFQAAAGIFVDSLVPAVPRTAIRQAAVNRQHKP